MGGTTMVIMPTVRIVVTMAMVTVETPDTLELEDMELQEPKEDEEGTAAVADLPLKTLTTISTRIASNRDTTVPSMTPGTTDRDSVPKTAQVLSARMEAREDTLTKDRNTVKVDLTPTMALLATPMVELMDSTMPALTMVMAMVITMVMEREVMAVTMVSVTTMD